MSPLLILRKLDAIERSVSRAREEHAAAGDAFATDFTHQDAAILNVLRACEQAIDAANILIREQRLGIPQSSRDSFTLLADAELITRDLGEALKRMVGFRNTATHQYQKLDLDMAEAVIVHDLDNLLELCRMLMAHVRG